MKITYDEYIATWQAPEAKPSLDRQISNTRQNIYERRLYFGLEKNNNSHQQLSNMSEEEFMNLRRYQMLKLFSAYQEAKTGSNRRLLWITPYTINPDDIRKVVGEKAGLQFNNDILALDQETINAVNYLAELREKSSDYVYSNKWDNSLTPIGMEQIVDEMITCKRILSENMGLSSSEKSGNDIYRQTDFVKRAIGKAQYRTHDELDNFSFPEKIGKNIFGIRDYELSWQELMNSKSKFWTKTIGKAIRYFDRKLNPDKERNRPRIGNKTVEVPDDYTK
ncbi:MAG: hypothetical protein IKM97_04275 [Clostridia bacterium]|nr:hypothetical protein [Clostridia bacterium]